MGGRGAKGPGGGGENPSGKSNFAKDAVGFKRNETLGEAIGEKGKPVSITEARAEVNPHFNPAYDDYSMNCQRCVVAYELNRRGYKVQAQETYEGDKLPYRTPYWSNKNKTMNNDQARWMGAFKGAKSENVGSTRKEGTIKNINKKMKEFGDGARGIVRVQWKGAHGGGHVFNVENRNGKMIYTDAQIGKRVDIGSYLGSAIPKETKLVRTDNLRISPRAKDFVRKR